MPLYMDIHTVDSDQFSAEDVVKAHMEDLSIQDKFDVKQLKYWVNEDAKTIFCLMEGPDKYACNQVHLQSHGNTACNIIEVADNEYNLYMGKGTDVDDLATTNSGKLDPGYRTILLTNIVCFMKKDHDYLRQITKQVIQYSGVIVREPSHQLMATFMYATDAILCATSIKNIIEVESNNLEFNLAVVSGRPVDEKGELFFEQTKLKVNGLCAFGLNKKLYLDKETIILADKEMSGYKDKRNNFTILDNEDLHFSMQLSKVVNDNLTRSDFSTNDLFIALGISKSQANRKIKTLTDLAPNQLIQESRLLHAVRALIQTNKTIAEIGYDSGFNSPSYFSRLFKKRFGISPTEFSKQLTLF